MAKLEAAAATAGRGAAALGPVPRSSTVLLIKNLPYSTMQQDLEVRRACLTHPF